MPTSRILVGTDGSLGAGRAVKAAGELAKGLNCDLLIGTFADAVPDVELLALAQSEGGVGEALDLLSRRILLEAREMAISVGAPKVRTASGSGEAAESY